MKLSHIPLRVTTGVYILNSGLSKRGLEGQPAEGMHAMAAGAIPAVKNIPPDRFAQLLSAAEIALGGALLAPFVSSRIAGAAMAGGRVVKKTNAKSIRIKNGRTEKNHQWTLMNTNENGLR